MSYIRPMSKRKFSKGSSMYVYRSGDSLVWTSGSPSNLEDFVEIMFRILERAEVDFDSDDLNKVRSELGLEK